MWTAAASWRTCTRSRSVLSAASKIDRCDCRKV
jgi:hypothetical protein